MARLTFKNFIKLRENSDEPKKTSNDRKLEKGQEFVVDRHKNASLVPIIKAFNDSGNVRIGDFIPGGFSTITKEKTEEPKLRKKSLYLVGGAVRDHLMNKKSHDYDVATDATPSEIRMILLSAGFTEVPGVGGQTKKINVEDIKSPKHIKSDPSKVFYSKGWDKEGNEFVFGIRVNKGEEIELATFREDSKTGDGRTPDKMTFSDLEGDAGRRDFTINSMYIKLDNPDGPNNKLIDPHNGLGHISGGKGGIGVNFVGKASDRLDEDQLRAFRYIRFYVKYGAGSIAGIPDDYREAIDKLAKSKFPAVSKERAREEFLKGLEDPDIDPKKYIRLYKNLNILPKIFPNLNISLDGPDDYIDEKDRLIVVAWILRKNNPSDVAKRLNQAGWPTSEVRAIKWLMHYAKMNPENGEELMRMHVTNPWPGQYNRSGRLEKWAGLLNLPKQNLNAFNKFLKSNIPSVYNHKGEVNSDFEDLVDPITQQMHGPAIGQRKNDLLRKIYQDYLKENFNESFTQNQLNRNLNKFYTKIPDQYKENGKRVVVCPPPDVGCGNIFTVPLWLDNKVFYCPKCNYPIPNLPLKK